MEHRDAGLAFALARAHNRAIVDFCSVDRRLLSVGYAPLRDPERAAGFAAEAITLGRDALMVSLAYPPGHGPSHIALEPVWAQAAEAVYPSSSTSAVAVSCSTRTTWPTGARRCPTSMAATATSRPSTTWRSRTRRCRPSELELLPSGYVRRQVRVTPYPHEDTGWIVREAGPELCLFSSDYPHVEGGRNPLGRFDRSLDAHGISSADRERFYRSNFEDLMGDRVGAARFE